MKKYKYFIYDLDGTLVNTSPAIKGALRLTEESCGLPKKPDYILERFIGPPLDASYKKHYGLSEEETLKAIEAYREHYKKTSSLAVIYGGIEDALKLIKSSDAVSAVATLKNQQAAEETLTAEGIINYFSTVEAPAYRGETKSELINKCLEKLGCKDKNEAVFFGDSPYDSIGAMEAGIDFVAADYGFGFTEEDSYTNYPYIVGLNSSEDICNFVKEHI